MYAVEHSGGANRDALVRCVHLIVLNGQEVVVVAVGGNGGAARKDAKDAGGCPTATAVGADI